MTNLLRHAEVTALLERLAPLEDQLLPNERQMVQALGDKYAQPGVTDFDDARCLEVILRNLEIRKGFETIVEEDG